MVPSASDFLHTSQNADGGWGYLPGQASAVEPTSAAIMGLRDEPKGQSAVEGALSWLSAAQNGDGGWGVARGAVSGWQTGWAILALAAAQGTGDAVTRGTNWLLKVKPAEAQRDDMQKLEATLAIDFTLRGWPWLPGEATWIEPTCLAVLALCAVTRTNESDARVAEAVRYLKDRRCRPGGWNVGNPVMFSQSLPPRTHPTALAVLALSRAAPEQLLPEDLSALRADMRSDGGALALASGLLALRERGDDDAVAAARLAEIQLADGSWNSNVYHTAFALILERGGI